jgi:hypothetical protein
MQKILHLFNRMEQSAAANNKTAASIWATHVCDAIDQAKRLARVQTDKALQTYYNKLRKQNRALMAVDVISIRDSSDQFQKQDHRSVCNCSPGTY